jgi:geranylgeranyl pyrophosphate synthase
LVTSDLAAEIQTTRRRKTAHLKVVPHAKALREDIRARCRAVSAALNRSRPLGKRELEGISRQILSDSQLPEGFLGWTMVILASEFWRDQVASIPPARRLLLLPRSAPHSASSSAQVRPGLDRQSGELGSVADVRSAAESLGYKVLVAEGSPTVLRIIANGEVDAIVGVAALDILENAIDNILLAGIPCMAVPLLEGEGLEPSFDDDWVRDLIQVSSTGRKSVTRSYVHLLRAAHQLFRPAALARLAPRLRRTETLREMNVTELRQVDPIAGTEAIAYDFLLRGGKHLRPFVTLAVYDALTGGRATAESGERAIAAWPAYVHRAALSIETFHKASLVHDDIEDGDEFRYGSPALHAAFGIPVAINVGDYLIGLGYRLVSREAAAMGSDAVADLVEVLAGSHQRLSEGQGAELLWRDGTDKRLSPDDALRIYALKTAPAFEAAFLMGVRLAGPLEPYAQNFRKLARDLGIAFQILNDLRDWDRDPHNKLAVGRDLIGGRPTVLWALALQRQSESGRAELERLVADRTTSDAVRLERASQLYAEANVFEQAHQRVDQYQQSAEEIARAIQPDLLRDVLAYLIDLVLERHEQVRRPLHFVEPPAVTQSLPVTSP